MLMVFYRAVLSLSGSSMIPRNVRASVLLIVPTALASL